MKKKLKISLLRKTETDTVSAWGRTKKKKNTRRAEAEAEQVRLGQDSQHKPRKFENNYLQKMIIYYNFNN